MTANTLLNTSKWNSTKYWRLSIAIYCFVYVCFFNFNHINAAPSQRNNMRSNKNHTTGNIHANAIPEPKNDQMLKLPTVLEVAKADPELSMFYKLLKESGFNFSIENSRDITIFMPTNNAMKNFNFDINKIGWSLIYQIVNYHIIINKMIKVEEEPTGVNEYETLEGSKLKIGIRTKDGHRLYTINEEAQFVGVPMFTENANGLLYKINKLLIPNESFKSLLSENNETGLGIEQTPEFLQQTNADHEIWNSVIKKNFTRPIEEFPTSDAGILNNENGTVGIDDNNPGVIKTLSVDDNAAIIPSKYGFVSQNVGWSASSNDRSGIEIHKMNIIEEPSELDPSKSILFSNNNGSIGLAIDETAETSDNLTNTSDKRPLQVVNDIERPKVPKNTEGGKTNGLVPPHEIISYEWSPNNPSAINAMSRISSLSLNGIMPPFEQLNAYINSEN